MNRTLAFLAVLGALLHLGASAGLPEIAIPVDEVTFFNGTASDVAGDGALFGVSLINQDPLTFNLSEHAIATGVNPGIYLFFVNIPLLEPRDLDRLNNWLPQITALGAVAAITLEPYDGLGNVTVAALKQFTDIVKMYEEQGLVTLIRFAHEMNGFWYIWGQKPELYKKTFQLVYDTLHQELCHTSVMWSPNNGGTNQVGGTYQALPGTADFIALDTNKDGELDDDDDIFTPYYPGDEYVDWTGLTFYAWLNAGDPNKVAEPTRLRDQITKFYNKFVAAAGKPMALPETGAMFNYTQVSTPNKPLPSELDVKGNWLRQVMTTNSTNATGTNATNIAVDFPLVKAIMVFDSDNENSGFLGRDPAIAAVAADLIATQTIPGTDELFWRTAADAQAVIESDLVDVCIPINTNTVKTAPISADSTTSAAAGRKLRF